MVNTIGVIENTIGVIEISFGVLYFSVGKYHGVAPIDYFEIID